MIILGLDLSTRVGWAVFQDDQPEAFGTKLLPKPYIKEDYAARTLPLRVWLRKMIEEHKPDVLAFEAPWIPMAPRDEQDEFNTTQHTLRLQLALATEVETTAKECGIREVREVASSTAKKALTGTGRIPTKDKPRVMLSAALAKGWKCADDHQADAGAVCLVVLEEFGVAA